MKFNSKALIPTNTGLRLVLLLLLMLLAFAARVVTSAASELAAGEAAEARGDRVAALVFYRRAGRFYAPFSPYHGRALSRLLVLAETAEQEGDSELALAAYRAVRSAILSTRSFYTPEFQRLQLANRHIATLMARQPPPPMDAGKSEAELRAEHLALLTARPGPHQGFALLALVGFTTWVLGAFFLFARGMSTEGKLLPKQATRYGFMIALGLAAFGAGLWMA